MEDLRAIEATPSGSSDHWYALRCKSNMEFVVNDQLRAKLIPNYLPVYAVKPVNPRSHPIKPYFPGYLFVNDEPEKLYAEKVFLMRGVLGLVNFDGAPASIHPKLIEAVRRQVQQLNLERKQARSGFVTGDAVLVEDDVIGQLEGIFEKCINGKDRVSVLLRMMQGGMMRMELPAEKVRRKPVKNG
jgi:transcription antitermination factor NusG